MAISADFKNYVPNTNGSSAGYHDLIISGTGIKTFPATLRIAGDFTNNGTIGI